MINIKDNLFILLIFITLFSCNQDKENFTFERSNKAIRFLFIEIDSTEMKLPKSSYVGFFEITHNNIFFFDKLFATVSNFRNNGEFIKNSLGKGSGPSEVESIQSYLKVNDKNIIFKGYDIYTFDKNWTNKQKKVINWNQKSSLGSIENNPNPKLPEIYELRYFQNKFAFLDSEYIIFNIESTHPKFNEYFPNTALNYYKNARIFAKLDTKSGKVISVAGSYSQKYLQNTSIPIFSNWYYDVSQEYIFLNFEIDSQIYVYDKNFNPIKAFGIEGIGMNQNYRKTKSYDEAGVIHKSERVQKGYYADIKYFEKEDILFRCYTTGINLKEEEINDYFDNPRRMQIYQGTTLIADMKVPNRFKIIGKIGEHYYADGLVDEQNEKIAVYRFKLPLKNAGEK